MKSPISTCISQAVTLTMLFLGTHVMGQTALEDHGENKTFQKHRLTILMANAFIPAADNIADQSSFFIVPAWGFNYDYWVNPKIGFGIHNAIILQQYRIEKASEETIVERSFPVIISAETLLKPLRKLTVSLGAGRELEKHESFNVISAGVEYGFELRHGWELGLTLLYDNKLNAYDSWMLGVGFSKFFPSTN